MVEVGLAGLAGILWVAMRMSADGPSHRGMAVALLTISLLLPPFLVSLGAVTLWSSAVLTTLLIAVAATEAILAGKSQATIPARVTAYWTALLTALVTLLVLDLLHGLGLTSASVRALAALTIFWRLKVDIALLTSRVRPVIEVFSLLVVIAAPLALLSVDRWAQGPAGETGTTYQTSTYENLIWAVFGTDQRYAGPFAHPNTLGAFAAIAFAIGLVGPRVRVRLLLLSTVLALLSGSRAAGIAIVVSSILLVFARHKVRGRLLVAVLACGLAVLVVTALRADKAYLTGVGRYDVWREALSASASSRLVGLGRDGSAQLVEFGDLPPWAISPHSIWIEAILTAGVIGLALTCAVVVTAARLRAAWPILGSFVVLSSLDNVGQLRVWGIGSIALVAIAASATPEHPDPPEPLAKSNTPASLVHGSG